MGGGHKGALKDMGAGREGAILDSTEKNFSPQRPDELTVHQDMSRPLSEYWIFSSYCTYLAPQVVQSSVTFALASSRLM